MSNFIQELIGKNLRYYLEKHESHKFDGNKTLCPFHNDTSPSMTVDEKAGVWLWYCHGKCKMGGDIITYYMKKHGVTKGVAIKELAKVFGLEIVKQAIKKPVIVATYPYLDEQGKQLYKIIRYNPKTFRADRKLNDIRQVLYRLPEVMKANSLWLVEGEKDVDNVHKLGLTVTTAPFGMSNWKPEFAQSLKGKEVRICLDVGAETEARKRAASILRAGAAEVKIIELPGLDKEGSDISDWINSHDSQTNEDLKLQLEGIAEEAPCFELPGGKLKINNNFLDLYIDSISRITDAPEIFILFSGLGLLSAVCNKFYFKYPRITTLNLYILLLAPSTFYRKSVMIDIVSDYLSEVNAELLLPDSFTSEALLHILSKHSRGLLAWRELIQVKEFQFGSDYNKSLPSLLTDLFDFKAQVRRWTKTDGETIVNNPIISILAAGISTWLVQGLKQVDFQGGIWTRFLFVPIEEDNGRKFQLPKEFTTIPAITEKLKRLNEMEAQKIDISEIYPLLLKWGERHHGQAKTLDNDLLKATFQRLEVALLKIACLLQLADDETITLKPKTFNEAVKVIEYLKRILPPFFEEEIVFTPFDRDRIKVLKYIKEKSEVGHRELRRYSHFETKTLLKILDQLIGEELVDVKFGERTGPGPRAKIYYYKGE